MEEQEEKKQQLSHPVEEDNQSLHAGKNCLNCGTLLHGHYCSKCGQKDEDLHEPFWKVFAEAFADFWHFDTKVFQTFYPLLFKPGFLTKEYIEGRRARYVHPIRLYFFLSVVFFVCYFTFSFKQFIGNNNRAEIDSASQSILNHVQDSLHQEIGNKYAHITIAPQKTAFVDSASNRDSSDEDHLPATIEEYEDSISKLPKDSVPGFFQQAFDKKLIEVQEKGAQPVFSEIAETANHNLPKIMFVLLPIFALLLKLLYIRRKVFFVDHAIFSLHFHAFAFVIFLIGFGLMAIFSNLNLGTWMVLILLIYLFIALKKMYRQTIKKTLLKVFLLLISYSFFIGVVLVGLLVYSALI